MSSVWASLLPDAFQPLRHPAQIFLPILPPTLVAFLAAALIGRLTGRNLPPNPRRKPRASAAATPDPSVTSLPFFSPPAAAETAGVTFPLWKGGPHETSLSHIPLRLDTGLLLDGLLHFAFLFQRISAGPRILQHPDRPAAWACPAFWTALLQPFVGARADHLKVLSLGQFAALLILAMLLCTGGLLLLPGQAVQGDSFSPC